MSRTFQILLVGLLAGLLAILISEVWWGYWKAGWPGPPIRLFSYLRGEGSAGDPRPDMTLLAWLSLVSLGLAARRRQVGGAVLTNVRASVLVGPAIATSIVSVAANNITLAASDMAEYNPYLVASLALAAIGVALLRAPLRRAAVGWRLVAALVLLVLLLNGGNAIVRLLAINLGS